MSCRPKKWPLWRSSRWWRFDCTLRTVATFSRCSSLRSMVVLSGAPNLNPIAVSDFTSNSLFCSNFSFPPFPVPRFSDIPFTIRH